MLGGVEALFTLVGPATSSWLLHFVVCCEAVHICVCTSIAAIENCICTCAAYVTGHCVALAATSAWATPQQRGSMLLAASASSRSGPWCPSSVAVMRSDYTTSCSSSSRRCSVGRTLAGVQMRFRLCNCKARAIHCRWSALVRAQTWRYVHLSNALVLGACTALMS